MVSVGEAVDWPRRLRSQGPLVGEHPRSRDPVPHKSHVCHRSVLPAPLISRMAEFAQCAVMEKLVTLASDMCISGPRGNAPKAELLLNTKIAIQYSKDRLECHDLEPIVRKCAQCRGSNEEEDDVETDGSCCQMGTTGCEQCVGRPYVCPVSSCGVCYVRRWAYETGSGRGSIGRSLAQFRVLPFTRDMHSMVEEWDKHASLPYNNVNLVTYCGADMCAHCACGLKHGSIKCGSVLHMHQDNGQGASSANSQAECAVNRTLNVGETRILTMSLVKHLGGSHERVIPCSEVEFELTHGSEFLLDTADEVDDVRETQEGQTTCSWKHGMITPIRDAGISCGFVGRTVQRVRDVRTSDDVVIDRHYDTWVASKRGHDFRVAAEEWRALSTTYTAVIGPRVVAALNAWGEPKRQRRKV
jgi:hypothetical protein